MIQSRPDLRSRARSKRTLWGIPRATLDVDVNIFNEDDELQRVVDALSSLGIASDLARMRQESRARGLTIVHFGAYRVDLFTPSIPFSREAERTRRRVEIDGQPAWFLSPEALAVFKLLFFRPKDISRAPCDQTRPGDVVRIGNSVLTVSRKGCVMATKFLPTGAICTALLMLFSCAADVDTLAAIDQADEALSAAQDIHWKVANAGGPVAFSPDGSVVATGSTQDIVQLLSTTDGSVVKTFRIRGTANGVSFSPDGTLLAMGTSTGPLNLRLYNVQSGQQVFHEKAAHANQTEAVAFSPTNNGLFATAGRDKTTANTKLWDTQGNIVRSFDDGRRVLAMVFAHDGQSIVSNASGTIHVWRISDGALLLSIANAQQFAVAISPDGKFITDGATLFDAHTGAVIRALSWPNGGADSVTFTADSSTIVVGGSAASGASAAIRYFRVSDGAVLKEFLNLGNANSYVQSVAVSPNAKQLAYGVATDRTTALATF